MRQNHLQTDDADGLSDYEIAKQMGISRSLVFQIRQRAMKKLRLMILEDPDLREVVEEIVHCIGRKPQ